MNRSGVLGLITGIAAIFLGIVLEGGSVSFILQPAAAVIVFGATLGATLLSYSAKDIVNAIASLKDIFFIKNNPEVYKTIDDLIIFSDISRKKGIISIESFLVNINEPFFKRMLGLAVDGMPPTMLKGVMEEEILNLEETGLKHAQVFETAGAVSPTIGIIGAVIGLIQVMQNISEPSRLGQGIAVAFVATLYGVGLSNLILLPFARKIKNNLYRKMQLYRIVAEGIVGIQSGVHPHYLREKLLSMTDMKGDSDAS